MKKFLINKGFRALLLIFLAYSLLLLISGFKDSNHSFTFCIFKNITGYPCPGCGLGRGTIDIIQGHFLQSFQHNIIAIPINIVVFISIIWMVMDLIREQNSFWRFLNRKIGYIYILSFIALALVSWGVNIARGI